MPNRIIRDAILDSPRYHALSSDSCRLLYIELLLLADDYGLLPVYPLYLQRHTSACRRATDEAVNTMVAELMDKEMLLIYAANGANFAYILRFGNWPRAKKPKWPMPPDTLGGNEIKDLQKKRIAGAVQMHSTRIANVPETETETETETVFEREVTPVAQALTVAAPAQRLEFEGDSNQDQIAKRTLVKLSAKWELPEAWGVDAERLGWKNGAILQQGEKFRQYWTAGRGSGTARTVKGWRQSWSNWLDKAALMNR